MRERPCYSSSMSLVQLRGINTNLLIALDALLQTHSVTEAAHQLSVTPSAASHSLRQLRELLGDPLLVRGQRGLRPTPLAESLRGPLRRALVDLQRVLQPDAALEPERMERRFVIAAPDFLGSQVAAAAARLTEAWPNVLLDVMPSERRGNAWRLETGEFDLCLGAVLDIPGARIEKLFLEHHVCIAAKDHPRVRGHMSLDQYARERHALIGIDDTYEPRATWVDQVLADHGLVRRVSLRSRFFVGVATAVAASELISTVPSHLARWAEASFPLQIMPTPIDLPDYPEQMAYHPRFEHDPAHRWLREIIRRAAADVHARYGRPEDLSGRGVAHSATDPYTRV